MTASGPRSTTHGIVSLVMDQLVGWMALELEFQNSIQCVHISPPGSPTYRNPPLNPPDGYPDDRGPISLQHLHLHAPQGAWRHWRSTTTSISRVAPSPPPPFHPRKFSIFKAQTRISRNPPDRHIRGQYSERISDYYEQMFKMAPVVGSSPMLQNYYS